MRVGEGGELRAEAGPARPAIAGHQVSVDVVIDSASDAALRITVAGRAVRVAAGGASIETIDPATRGARFGDLVSVIQEARAFYGRVAATADR